MNIDKVVDVQSWFPI